MEAVATELDAISAISGASTASFAEVYVTLTKLEHIQLVIAYFSPSWTPFQADRGRHFSVIVDGVSD